MWLGEKITEYGIGNGISLIIYAGIVASFPGALGQQLALIGTGEANVFGLIIYFVLLVIAMAGMVLVQQSERRIPVQYARKVVGRKVMGGQSTYIPLRLNAAEIGRASCRERVWRRAGVVGLEREVEGGVG